MKMKKNKITHINFAKGFRGGERQTLLLIEELSKNSYTQQLVTRKNSELALRVKQLNLINIEIIQISKPYLFSLYKIKDAEIIHAHETKGAQFAYFAYLIYKIPYMVTRRVDNKIKNNFFTKAIYDNAKYTIALSKAIENEIRKVSLDANVNIIPSAYSNLEINESNVKILKKRFEKKFLIGNIGELHNEHKGQYYLIEAIKQLSSKYPDIHLIILGKGKDEENYNALIENSDNITLEGFVSNVADYIACFNLFVFPSLNEGLGSILLDVMQANVPIIATNVGGIPDIIQNQVNGILINPKSIDEIVANIELIYNDYQLGLKLSNNSLKIINNFSTMAMANSYMKIYQTIKSH